MAAKQPQRKLTKAEAGRLGGLRTKQRHGTEHFRRAGKRGAEADLTDVLVTSRTAVTITPALLDPTKLPSAFV